MVSTQGIRTLWLALAILLGGLCATATAEVIDWPIGNADAAGNWVPGYGAYVQQNFENTTHPDHQGQPHAGIDLQLRDPATGQVSGPHTAGQTVRAAAGGYVEYRNPQANWPGGILALRHRDRKGNDWYTMYAHVDNLINVPVGTWVGRGSVIGTIHDQEQQYPGNSHLHFEVRNEEGDSFPGAGYGGAGQNLQNLGWFDPLDHYYTHRRACTGEGLHYTAPGTGMRIRSTPQVANNLVETLARGTVVQVEDVVADSGGAANWWFKVAYRSSNQVRVGFTAAVADGGYGSVLNMVQRWRACQLIVPGFNNGSGRPWDTNLYVRNNGPLQQNVLVKIYHPHTTNGSFSQVFQIPANGSKKISIDSDFENGTAIIEGSVSEGTEDLSVVARHHVDNPGWAGGDAFSAYEAVRQGSAKQVVPVVHQNNWDWYNTITLYNPDNSTRHVDLHFTGASFCNQTNYVLGGRKTLVINTSTWKNGCLPYRYVGSLEITSTNTSGDPRPVMVTSRQENRIGTNAYESMATVSLTPSAKKLYLPLIQNQNYNYRAGLGAGRITGSGSLQADFRRADNGNSCLGETLGLWPVIETPFPTSNQSACPQVISAHLDLTGNGQMFAQFNQLYEPPKGDPNPNHDASSSPASAHPNYRAYVPYLDASSTRGIQIQNTENDSTLVRLYFYNFSGNLVDFRTVTVPGYGSATLVSQIPGSARNARIESDNRVVVLVNNVMNTGTQDDLMDYVAPSGVD